MNIADKTDKRPGVVMYPDGGLYRYGDNKFQCDGWGRNRKVFVAGLDIMDCRDFGYISLGVICTKGWRSSSIRAEVPADPDTLDAIAEEFAELAKSIRVERGEYVDPIVLSQQGVMSS